MSGMRNPVVDAYVGLGSNLQHPEAQLQAAIAALHRLPGTSVDAVSHFYRTAPVDLVQQPDFLNAVVRLRTALAPRPLLDALLAIEQSQGRIRSVPNGPRTLDLDLLMHADHRMDEPGLVLPHPRMLCRAFVMVPLGDVAPDLILPGGVTVRNLATRLAGEQRIERANADAVA